MKEKHKNTLSNIMGILVFILATYSLVYQDLELIKFAVLSIIGLALFLFKASSSRNWLNKIIGSKIK